MSYESMRHEKSIPKPLTNFVTTGTPPLHTAPCRAAVLTLRKELPVKDARIGERANLQLECSKNKSTK